MVRSLAYLLPALVLIAGCAPASTRNPEPTQSPTTSRSAANPYTNLSAGDRDRALLDATAAGDATKVSQLLDTGADTEVRDDRERTPLLIAVTEDHVSVARQLVRAGADPDALDDRHDTPWLVTGVTGSVPMAKVILAAKPDLTIENRFGGLSVIPASERGHADYVEYVVEHSDIDIDHVNDLGWTALLEAVILGKGSERWHRVVRALVDAGADLSIRDPKGMTALEHARARGFDEIATILERG